MDDVVPKDDGNIGRFEEAFPPRYEFNLGAGQRAALASSTSRNFFSRWKNRKAKELGSERSVRDYRDITDAFIEFLAILARADEEISRITPSDIIKFRDSLLERVAPVTANKYVKVLRGAFQDALRERLISENPARVELVGSIKKERGSGDGPASV